MLSPSALRHCAIFLIMFGLGSVASAAPDSPDRTTKAFTPQELAQGFTNQKVIALPRAPLGAAHDDIAEVHYRAAEEAAGFEIDRVFPRFDGMRVLVLPEGMTPAVARASLMATGRYEFVDFDLIRQTAVLPSDPSIASGAQWHHRNTGQSSGTVGADINTTAAWDIRTDASTVIVAVIDTGVRLTHQDIVPNLWTNPGEIPGNNRDDDRNGYIDDVHGIDARDGSGDPSDHDNDGHGTHVAGIIGAAANNGVAGAGVAWNVKMMHLRYLGGADGNGALADGIECIDYAIENGAKVINASYGSDGLSSAERQAIQRTRDAGIVFVCAAGNEGDKLDLTSHYPAAHLIDNIVTVGNSTRLDDLSPSSNTSSGLVDLVAPGSDILSLGVDSDTATRVASGTSMSSPMVAGAIALLRAQYPADNYRATINRLLRGARPVNAFRDVSQTGGRLDVAAALTTTDTRPFNDDFADRAVLAGEVITVRNSNVNATTESGEPSHAGRLSRSLWWTWTAPAAGLVQLDTRGSLGDTQLAVYTGENLSTLTRLTDNDNESAGFLTSRTTFNAVTGATYHFAVDSSSAGLVVLNLAAAAANDAFASAQLLDGDAPIYTTTNANATAEPGEPSHFTGANRKSLWYRFIAPRDGTFQVSAYSTGADTVLAVYTGSSVDALTLIGRNDDTGPGGANINANVQWQATEDHVYHIALDTLGTATGEITLSLTDALWQFSTGAFSTDEIDRRPTVTNAPSVGLDGTIYVGSSDEHFYAINPDGSQRWRVATEGYPDSSSAAIAPDGTIHFGTNQGVAYALNPDGTTRWSVTVGNSPYFAAPAVGPDGTSYYKQDEGILRAFDPDGNALWTYAIDGEASYAGACIAGNGTVYYPANDGAIHALSPQGSRLWVYRPKTADGTDDTSGIFTSPAIDGTGNIYASTLNGTVFSITPGGQLRWVFRTPESGENVSSSLALGDGRVLFASYGAYLYSLEQSDGSLIWRSSIEAQARASSPAIAEDGSVIVGSYANKLFRFDRDGNRLRAWSAGNWFRSSPTLADGRIYIGNGDGKVYAFDLDGLDPASGPQYRWPQYRHGPRHLGRATVEVIGRTVAPSADNPGRLVNLSVRNRTARGADALIAGFVLQGTTSKPLVVRGIGPALDGFGVEQALTASSLEIFNTASSTVPIATNSGWTTASGDGRELGAFSLSENSADSVVRASFGSEPFTAQVRPRDDATEPGVALVEIYDAATHVLNPRLTNLSARTHLSANQDVTVGFVIQGATPRRVLIRAIGPGLAKFEVPNTLADPRLTLLSGQSAEVGNDNWRGLEIVRASAEQVGAFPLENNSADAALVTTLPPGPYTTRVTAPANQGGIVLVEVYLLPEPL